MNEILKNIDKLMLCACFVVAAMIFVFFPFPIAMILGWWPVLALLNIMAKNKLEDEIERLGKELKCAEEREAKRQGMISRLQDQIAEDQGMLADLKKKLEAKPRSRAKKPKAEEALKPRKTKAKKEKPLIFKEACKLSADGLQTFK